MNLRDFLRILVPALIAWMAAATLLVGQARAVELAPGIRCATDDAMPARLGTPGRPSCQTALIVTGALAPAVALVV